MALSKEEQEIIDFGKKNGKSLAEVKQAIALYRQTNNVDTPEPAQEETQSFGEDFKQDYLDIGNNAVEQFRTAGENIVDIAKDDDRGFLEKTVGIGGEAFKRGGRFIGGTLLQGLKMAVPQKVEDKTAETVASTGNRIAEYASQQYEELKASDKPEDQKIVEMIDGFAARYRQDEDFRQNVDAAGGFAEGALEIIGAGAAVRTTKAAGTGAKEALLIPTRKLEGKFDAPYFRQKEAEIAVGVQNANISKSDRGTAGKVTDKMVDAAVIAGQKTAQTYRDLVEGSTRRISENLDRQALRENAELPIEKVETNIGDMYVNAVSPGVKGKKKTVEGIVQNKQNAVSSIKNIVEEQEGLTFRDIETNEMVTGELPTNLWEFGGAITHQKSAVYNRVLESIGAAADEPIDMIRITDEMDKIIDNPVYAGETAILKRAEEARAKYILNEYTPKEIEELIQLENDRLQAFYRGSGTQADAVVSAIVANNLRDMLDEAVEQAGGEGVRQLKAQYGALKSIENDVIHRALHNSQAREAGLVDMFGIRTIGDVAAGAAGDLGALKRGAGQIAGEGFIKALNDRDAMINRMFLVADQTYGAGNVKKKPTSPVADPEAPVEVDDAAIRTEVQSLLDKAPEARDYIDNIATEVAANDPEIKLAIGVPIKGIDRATQKVIQEEAGDVTALKDLARNSIIPMTEEKLASVIAAMDARPDILRKKVQEPEKFSGYGGIIYNIEAPNGLVSEIQVVEPRMIFGKMLPEDSRRLLGDELWNQIKDETGLEPGYGHVLYEKMRELSEEEFAGVKGQELMQESFDYYNSLR